MLTRLEKNYFSINKPSKDNNHNPAILEELSVNNIAKSCKVFSDKLYKNNNQIVLLKDNTLHEDIIVLSVMPARHHLRQVKNF